MRFWGALLLVLSVCAFVSRSEASVFSALTALPLLGLWLYFLWQYVASSRARPSAPSPGRRRQVTWAVAGLGITRAVEAAFLVSTFSRERMTPLEVFEEAGLTPSGALWLVTAVPMKRYGTDWHSLRYACRCDTGGMRLSHESSG
jgi:hypothetical protein